MDRAAPSAAPRHPDMPDLMAEICPVVQALPVFLTAPLYRRWHLRWGATAAEATAELPGDTMVPAAQYRSTRAITIDAPASEIWPWLVQMGLPARRLLQRRPAGQPGSPERYYDHPRTPAPRGWPADPYVAAGPDIGAHRVQRSLLPGQRVAAVEQTGQHMGVVAHPDRHGRDAAGGPHPRLVRLAAPAGRDGRRAADGVRRLRHAPADAAWHQGTRGIRPQGPARKPGRQVEGVGL